MTMNTGLRRLAVTLIITIVLLLSFTLVDVRIGFSSLTDGKIDLFTQKEPYSGKGLNMPSDAFGLGELVILYALVTYGGIPLENLMVTFYVKPPEASSFCLTAETNASGIATFSFTIPQKCVNESEVFGEWMAFANALFDGNTFQDILTFKVDWIVKLISVRTIDENLTHQSSFGIGGDIGLEITLRNVAMTMKNVTLAIVIQDELNVPVNSSIISDLEAQPNEKLILLYCKLYLPKWSHIGMATVFVSALTTSPSEGGVPYCPAISATFLITSHNPRTIAFHDVAVVNAVPSATSVELGQSLNVSAVVRNEGTEVESFNVSAYCDSAPIGTLKVATLLPYSKVTLNFILDTSLFTVGNYTITVSISYITNEADLTDNVFVDGIIEIKPELPQIIHDIAILNVTISTGSLYIGDLLEINVSVVNKGTETEGFDVGTYYDSSLIGTMRVDDFAPNAQVNLIFMWNTSSISEGFYQISASASPVPDEIDLSDNTFVDGVVQVLARPPIHDVAVLSVIPSSTFAYIGETVDIHVIVKNHGIYTESFNVTAFCNAAAIETLLVENLEPNAERTLLFHWNTHNIAEGNYTLTASASMVPGEENLENNSYVDGVVEVVKGPEEWLVPDWFYWLLPLLLLLIIILLIAWLYRRRKKNAGEAFYKGWTAWYYGYNLAVKFVEFRICS